MKIKARIAQLDHINANNNYLSTKVAIKAIDDLKLVENIFDNSICSIYVANYDSDNLNLINLIGKCTKLFIEKSEDGNSYLSMEGELMDTHMGIHVKNLLCQGANLKAALNATFYDHYTSAPFVWDEVIDETYGVDLEASDKSDDELEELEDQIQSIPSLVQRYCYIDKMDINAIVVEFCPNRSRPMPEFYIQIVEEYPSNS